MHLVIKIFSTLYCFLTSFPFVLFLSKYHHQGYFALKARPKENEKQRKILPGERLYSSNIQNHPIPLQSQDDTNASKLF